MTKDLPSPELLRKLLRYDAETGKLFWLHRPRSMFTSDRVFSSWNSRFSGNEAFSTIKKDGYMCGGMLSKTFKAHRVAWALYFGQWPEFEIDHINGDRSDNRIKNLRSATKSINQRNSALPSNNTSGHHGVSFDKLTGKWRAWIAINGKFKHLGLFFDIEDAISARRCSEAGLGFTERHGS